MFFNASAYIYIYIMYGIHGYIYIYAYIHMIPPRGPGQNLGQKTYSNTKQNYIYIYVWISDVRH